jgi:hypothetical protein
MTSIAVTGALLHPQLRSVQVASHQKLAPAMPMTLIIAPNNFRRRRHFFLMKEDMRLNQM